MAGTVAIVAGFIFLYLQTATSGLYVDPITGARDYRAWVTWDCISPLCVWNSMGSQIQLTAGTGLVFALGFVALLVAYGKRRERKREATL